MKSIKEKAKEYAKIKHTDQNLIEIVSWDFEAGANYVLGEMEKCVKSSLNSRLKIDTIKQIVEQLRK